MAVAKYRRPLGQQLPLPGADLVGMDVIFAGDLVDRFESLGRLQGDRELELIAELSAFSAHLNVSTSFGIVVDST